LMSGTKHERMPAGSTELSSSSIVASPVLPRR
jgi:hypothetical protein